MDFVGHSKNAVLKSWGRRLLAASALVAWGFASEPAAASPAAPASDAAWRTYLSGLEALRDGRWREAERDLTRALSSGLNEPAVYLARGVTHALAAQFEQAVQDFGRDSSREALVWKYAVDKMSGTTRASGGGFPVIRSLQREYGQTTPAVSIPGHLIQGGSDYSTDYASHVYYDMATPYAEAREARQPLDSPELRRALADAGRWFGNRWLARREFAPLHLERARKDFASRRYRPALEALAFVHFNSPVDPDVNHLSAESQLALGHAVTARRAYTRALTYRTDFAAAYLGRARAAARMGDAVRVERDLEAALRLDPSLAPWRKEVAGVLQEAQAKEDPRALQMELASLAQKGAPVHELVPLARRLYRALMPARKRYDEWYQEERRAGDDAIRARPREPAPYVAAARFLIDEAGNRGEEVEPRRGRVPLRFQVSAAEDCRLAVRYADRALELDPKHIEASVAKALALLELGEDEEARRLVDRVLQSTGFDHPEALKLYAEFKFRRAGMQQMTAMSLRTPTFSTSTHREWRADGLWDVKTTYRSDPSPSDIRRADALATTATANLREAELALRKAVALTRGTLDGYLLEADYEHWYKSRQRAGQLLVEAITKHPSSLKARDKFAWWCRWMGAEDQAVDAEAAALGLVHTSAAPYLGKIWTRLVRNQASNPVPDLERAVALDPVDARAAAYRGALHAHHGEPERAAASYKIALALEEARLSLDEPPEPSASALPRSLQELALAMEMRYRLGTRESAAGNFDRALAYHEANASLVERAGPGSVAQPMFGALLPDPALPALPHPTPPNGANLLARAHLEGGRLHARQGREDVATAHFEKAASFGKSPARHIPNIGTGKGDSNFAQFATAPAAEAYFELSQRALEKGDVERANHLFQGATANGPPEHMRPQLNDLSRQIVERMNRRLATEAASEQEAQQEAIERQFRDDARQAQERERQRRSGAPVDPVLVGVWKTSAESPPFTKSTKIELSITSDGGYTLVEGTQQTSGKLRAWNSRMQLTPSAGAPRQAHYRYVPGRSFNPQVPAKTQLQLVLDGAQLWLEK